MKKWKKRTSYIDLQAPNVLQNLLLRKIKHCRNLSEGVSPCLVIRMLQASPAAWIEHVTTHTKQKLILKCSLVCRIVKATGLYGERICAIYF